VLRRYFPIPAELDEHGCEGGNRAEEAVFADLMRSGMAGMPARSDSTPVKKATSPSPGDSSKRPDASATARILSPMPIMMMPTTFRPL
jgi:hypothetical protein